MGKDRRYSEKEERKPMIFRPVPLFIQVASLVVKIEREDIVLLVDAGNDVCGVTIFALVELFEETKAFGDAMVFSKD